MIPSFLQHPHKHTTKSPSKAPQDLSYAVNHHVPSHQTSFRSSSATTFTTKSWGKADCSASAAASTPLASSPSNVTTWSILGVGDKGNLSPGHRSCCILTEGKVPFNRYAVLLVAYRVEGWVGDVGVAAKGDVRVCRHRCIEVLHDEQLVCREDDLLDMLFMYHVWTCMYA